MTPDTDEMIPLDAFAPPGLVNISDAALELARAFQQALKERQPDTDLVVVFDWAEGRQFRLKDADEWRELGPGIDLGAFRRSQIPDGVIHPVRGVELAVKISRDVYERAHRRLIDRDDGVLSKLVLR
jgi:hypothetical protein